MEKSQTKKTLCKDYAIRYTPEDRILYEKLMPVAEERAEVFTKQIMSIALESADPWQMVECMFKDILRDKYYSEMIRGKILRGELL